MLHSLKPLPSCVPSDTIRGGTTCTDASHLSTVVLLTKSLMIRNCLASSCLGLGSRASGCLTGDWERDFVLERNGNGSGEGDGDRGDIGVGLRREGGLRWGDAILCGGGLRGGDNCREEPKRNGGRGGGEGERGGGGGGSSAGKRLC